ncbi:MAG: glycosyltransferase family 2 protein [Verrucomicrobia subdivision 3 bacterium]|nr:glycosyltransferase family 2 protein [Limisphaerales bacterium]
MRTPLPISVAVITKDEEENLARCLESISGFAAEIVVIDSGSTDRTEEIARRFKAVFETHPWPGYVEQKNNALRRCSQLWVLALDADEVLSPELRDSIQALFAKGDPPANGYWFNRRTFYLGEWIWHAWYPEWRLRLVRRQSASWTGLNPHDYLEVAGATERLRGDLLHYSFRDLSDHLEKTIRYARIMANSYTRQGRRFHWYHWLFSPWIALFKHLIFKQGFRDGWRGWLISFVKWVDVFAKYSFLLERELKATKKVGDAGEPVKK